MIDTTDRGAGRLRPRVLYAPATDALCSVSGCSRGAHKTYTDVTGEERGFCLWIAEHAWLTMRDFPPAPIYAAARDAARMDARPPAASRSLSATGQRSSGARFGMAGVR